LVTIQAGRLTIAKVNPTTTDIQKDKTDVLLGSFKIINSGSPVRLDNLKVTATENGATIIRSAKLKLRYNGTTKNLDTVVGATYAATDISAVLPTGETMFDVVFSTTATAAPASTIKLSIDFSAAGTKIVETRDEKAVADITPASITFSTLTVKAATASVSVLPIAATNAVVGSSDVQSLKFNVAAGTISDMKLTRVVISAADVAAIGGAHLAALPFNKTVFSAFSIYKDSVTTGNLLKTVSPSDISGGQLAIDLPAAIIIPKNGSVNLIVTSGLVDNQANAAANFKFTIADVSLYDADNAIMAAVPGIGSTSTNGITLQGVGTLTLSEENGDSQLLADKNIVAGAESTVLGGWKFNATNEAIKLKKLTVTSTALGTNLLDVASTVTLLKADKTTVIASKDVTGPVVTFDTPYIINEGNEVMYVKITTLPFGKSQAGTAQNDLQLALTVAEAEGASSAKDVVAAMLAANTNTLVGKFSVVPVRLSTVSFVKTATVGNTTVNVANSLSAGEQVVAILQVTADKFTSTSQTTGDELKAQLEKLNLSITNTLAGSNVVIERVGGAGVNTATVVQPVTNFAQTDFASMGVNAQLRSQDVAYFAIKVTPNSVLSNQSVQVKILNLNADMKFGAYTNPATASATGIAPNLGTTSMTAESVVAK